MRILFIAPLLFIAMTVFGQKDYLKEGEILFGSGQFGQAEALFREAVAMDPENLNFQSQLGVCLIQLAKYDEAEGILGKVLTKDATNFSALWYSGVGSYSTKNYKKAIGFFEKVLPLLDQTSPQYPSAYWFIGKSLSGLLKTTGISSSEADRMFESYEKYLTLQPAARDAEKIKMFIAAAKQNRPATITDKWIAK